MTTSDGPTTRVAPDTLVSDIEATRADLARTIDAITDRISPRSAARRAMDRARMRVSDLDPAATGAVAAAVVVVGVATLWLWRRSKR
jgi:hypothetical protein